MKSPGVTVVPNGWNAPGWGAQIERVGRDRVGARIGRGQPRQAERVFREAQHRTELVLDVRDVAFLGIRRDDQQGDAKPEAVVVFVRRSDVIVEAAPIVPHDEDHRRVPKLALADGVDDRRDPLFAVGTVAARVVGVDVLRDHPRKGRQEAAVDVAQDRRVGEHDVLPVGPVLDVIDGLKPDPVPGGVLRDRRVRAPCQAVAVQFVGERRLVEAGRFHRPDGPIVVERRDLRTTTPVSGRQIDGTLRLTRDQILVSDEAGVEVRLEVAISEHVLVRDLEVEFRLRRIDVTVHRLLVRRVSVERLLVESVHLAVIVVAEKVRQPVLDVEADVDRQRLELNRRTGRVDAAVDGVGAGIAVKEVIEAAVLLDDQDDVFDGRDDRRPRRRRGGRGGRRRSRSGRRRRTTAAACGRQRDGAEHSRRSGRPDECAGARVPWNHDGSVRVGS